MPEQIFSLCHDRASVEKKLLVVEPVPAEWDAKQFAAALEEFLDAFDGTATNGVTRNNISRIVMPLGRFPIWAYEVITDVLIDIGEHDFFTRGEVGLDDVTDWDYYLELLFES